MVSWSDSSSIVKGASGLATWGRQVNDRMKRLVYLTAKPTPQAAIDAESGGVVVVPPEGMEIDEPLLLPRDESVWIVGEGRQPSIRGSANFPEGRALIE